VIKVTSSSAVGGGAGLRIFDPAAAPGVISFDGHAGFNIPGTDPLGSLDGQGLAMLTSRCWQALLRHFSPLSDEGAAQKLGHALGVLLGRPASTPEVTMMHYTNVQALGQARLAELHHQAQRDALARAARRARRARRQEVTYRAPALLTALPAGPARR
jgi:hypothetical protein